MHGAGTAIAVIALVLLLAVLLGCATPEEAAHTRLVVADAARIMGAASPVLTLLPGFGAALSPAVAALAAAVAAAAAGPVAAA